MNIKCALCKRNIKIGKLCDDLGVTRTAYYNWTAKKQRPSDKYLAKIAELLDCTVDDLLR